MVMSKKKQQQENIEHVITLAPEFVHSQALKISRYIDWSLPPMHNLQEIFEDIAKKAMSLGLDRVLEHLNGRPLRIGTVCSGTESPILALEMTQQGKRTQQIG